MQGDYHEMTIPEKKRFWQEHIRNWQESDQTQSGYCKRHGIKSSQWFYWKRRIGEGETSITFVPLKVPTRQESLSSDVSVRVITPNGFRIELDRGVSVPELARLICEVAAL